MTAVRALILIPALLLAFMTTDAFAQGRGRGNGRGYDNGEEFCRNGQGHPTYGWQWCADRGWTRTAKLDKKLYKKDKKGARDIRDDRYRDQYPNVYGAGSRDAAVQQGYADGYDKGLEDASRNRNFDPTRHGEYKSADRGYNSRYGAKATYQNLYRDGFRDGYNAGYNDRYRNDRNTGPIINGPTGSTARRRWPL